MKLNIENRFFFLFCWAYRAFEVVDTPDQRIKFPGTERILICVNVALNWLTPIPFSLFASIWIIFDPQLEQTLSWELLLQWWWRHICFWRYFDQEDEQLTTEFTFLIKVNYYLLSSWRGTLFVCCVTLRLGDEKRELIPFWKLWCCFFLLLFP